MNEEKLLAGFYLMTGVLMIIGAFFLLNSISNITGFSIMQEEKATTDSAQGMIGGVILLITITMLVFINNLMKKEIVS
jgi:hypothetical protein